MPERIEIAVFTISGRAEIESGREESDDEELTKEVVGTLNNRSKLLASNIEAEIRKSMPPHPLIMVQAEVRFYKGSLLMAATVTLLSWTGSIILDAVREELSQVIRLAVQRVMADLNKLVRTPVVGAMEITATAVLEIGRPRQPPLTAVGQLKRSPALTITVFILAILVLLLLADRFFVIALRDTVAVAPATSQSVSPQTK